MTHRSLNRLVVLFMCLSCCSHGDCIDVNVTVIEEAVDWSVVMGALPWRNESAKGYVPLMRALQALQSGPSNQLYLTLSNDDHNATLMPVCPYFGNWESVLSLGASQALSTDFRQRDAHNRTEPASCMQFGDKHYVMVSTYRDENGTVTECAVERPRVDNLEGWVPVEWRRDDGSTVLYVTSQCAQLNHPALHRAADRYTHVTIDMACPSDIADLGQVFQQCRPQVSELHDIHRCCRNIVATCPHTDPQADHPTLEQLYTELDGNQMVLDGAFSELCHAYLDLVYDTESGLFYRNPFCALCDGVSVSQVYSRYVCTDCYHKLTVDRNPQGWSFRLLVTDELEYAGLDSGPYRVCPPTQYLLMDSNSCVDINCTAEYTGYCSEPKTGRAWLKDRTQVLTVYILAGLPNSLQDKESFLGQLSTYLQARQIDYLEPSFRLCSESVMEKGNLAELELSGYKCAFTTGHLSYNTSQASRGQITELIRTLNSENIHRSLSAEFGFNLRYLQLVLEPSSYSLQCLSDKLQTFSEPEIVSNLRVVGLETLRASAAHYLVEELGALLPLDQAIYQVSLVTQDSRPARLEQRNYLRICANHLLTCQTMTFTQQQYYLSADQTNLTVEDYHVPSFQMAVDTIVLQNGELLICRENLQLDSLQEISHTTESLLTLTSSILSLIGYVSTFFVYCFLPSLRNTAGRLLMFLLFSMFVGHSCFLSSWFKVVVENTVLCSYVAGVQHYFWLQSMCWMNCAAVDVWSTFRSWHGSLAERKLEFKHFLVYSHLMPVAIISVFVSLLQNHPDYGYGGQNICWLFPYEALMYFFLLPMSVMSLLNICLFVQPLITIINKAKAETGVDEQGESIQQPRSSLQRTNLATVFKIAFLLGGVWFIGLLGAWLESVALQSVFSILASLQGVLIFICFATTPRVLRRCRSRRHGGQQVAMKHIVSTTVHVTKTVRVEADYADQSL